MNAFTPNRPASHCCHRQQWLLLLLLLLLVQLSCTTIR
jgi:hypothetical protein